MADTAAVILGTLPRFRNSVEAPTKQRAVLDAGPGRKTAWQDCPKERLPEWTAGPQLENGPELAEDCYQGRRTAPASKAFLVSTSTGCTISPRWVLAIISREENSRIPRSRS